ncbi:MAG: penicillin-binding protein 1C [Polyangiaceae bacterium]|nr:penicillin-binding protein 1C [Polyangiaceae bacterium]
MTGASSHPLWRVGRLASWASAAALLLCIAAVATTPLPEELAGPSPAEVGVRVVDRHGRLIRDVTADGGARATWVTHDELGDDLRAALLAAEDRRFLEHVGVDPFAVARALAQLALERRVVSGASTITQQLARTLRPRPRTLAGKLAEVRLALRIEWSLSKAEILEQYANRAWFGPNVRGVGAASRHYFDKSPASLGLGEAALLAGLCRGPSLYDPRRAPALAERRRNRVLDRLLAAGLASEPRVDSAKSEPVLLHSAAAEGGSRHFLQSLLSGRLAARLEAKGPFTLVRTTLDAALQLEVERAARAELAGLAERDVTAAAVVVVDNQSGEVLAYVGSGEFFDEKSQGQNDGVLALRQPGSALKPFVYAEALEGGAVTLATVLPDVEHTFATPNGEFSPKNYDGKYHGPVRVREALGSSLNVPAVVALTRVGTPQALTRLREFGFGSLTESAEHYGVALALGDGEVRLLELARAYAALARGGELLELSFVREARDLRGMTHRPVPPARRRVLGASTARLLVDALSDDHARAATFGRDSVLALPFPAMVKTGTSKGHRDNLAVGASSELTVAVWVGNFDGRPMRGTSGVTGAGPLFRQVMLAAMRERRPRALEGSDELSSTTVCTLSGKRPGPACGHTVAELFVRGSEPTESCDMHVQLWVERGSELLSHPACPNAEQRPFERYPPRYLHWARTSGRPIAPALASPRCQQARGAADDVRIAFPSDGDRFLWDPGIEPAQQRILARVATAAGRPRFFLDGSLLAPSARSANEVWLPLRVGRSRFRAEVGGAHDEVTFEVK